MTKLLPALLAIYSIFAPIEAVFFAAMPDRRQRAMLERSYARRANATANSDRFLICFSIMLVGLRALRGAAPTSFLPELLEGTTLIHVYVHRYSIPLADGPPRPPLQSEPRHVLSMPGHAWIELAVIAALLISRLWGMLASFAQQVFSGRHATLAAIYPADFWASN